MPGVEYDYETQPTEFPETEHHVGRFEAWREHGGQHFYRCHHCNANWSIVETSNGRQLETLFDGDESCSDELRKQQKGQRR